MEYLNSKELLINIPAKDIPPYNPKKHFFEQSNDVIQFYMSEMDKIKNGVNIGGYFINPWLYFHINVFKTPIPQRDNYGRDYEEIMNPLLDDNALFVTEMYEEAKKANNGLILFGTRGSTKSVLLASNTHWTNLTRPNGVFSITGGDKGDLAEVFNLLYTSIDNCHPAFTLPTLKRDEEKEIVFGVRYSNKNPFRNGRIRILNADGGKDNKSEKGAGGSPIGFIVDEALHEDTLIFYEDCEKPIKEVKAGDRIYGADGKLTTVLEVIDPGVVPMYEITLSDGRQIKASGNHLWTVYNAFRSEWECITTIEIITSFRDDYVVHYLPQNAFIEYPEKELETDPKKLGFILGRSLNSDIPQINLRSSINQRIALLEGLIESGNISEYRRNFPSACNKLFRSLYSGEEKIVAINSVKLLSEKSQAYCLKVDNEDHLFLAGDYIVTHNCGKFQFEKVFNSAIPAFRTPKGYKAVPILAGTSGNDKLSSDAKKVLSNPESYRMLPMNYSRLERFIREEDITWNNTKSKKFGVFLPGQMSYRLEVEKEVKSLGEILGIPDKNLCKIQIRCTNWKAASDLIEQDLNNAADEEARDGVRMYYPRDLDDVFLTKGRNSFPKEAIKRRIEELKEKGAKARNVELLPKESWFEEFYSDKKLAPTYYSGGIVDAPITLFTSLPDREPPKFRNVAGLDHYKLDGPAEEGSLGSFYVIQRRNVEINTPCEIILASYAARPNTHRVFNTTGERLLKVFNSLCNMESVDTSFQQHLQQKKIADSLLCPSFSFAQNKSGKNTTLTTKYGLYPTAGNNKVRMDYLFEWAKEEHVVGIADDGNQIIKLSVEFIDDIELLQEMLDYNSKGNFDRIAAFSHALIYARELDNANVTPKSENTVRENVNKRPIERRATFTQNKRKVFR